ncbi:MAG: hypothetical protein KDE34_00125 [Anaerolineales bacterium]|nr:hypothetical protein [Anaerolineales bacterium]
MSKDEQREKIAAALSPLDDMFAAMVRNGSMVIEPVQAPYIKSHQLYRLENNRVSRPISLHLAIAKDQAGTLLTRSSETMTQFSEAAEIAISDEAEALRWAQLYLEIAPPESGLFRILESAADIGFRPNLDDVDRARQQQGEQTYAPRIHAPAVRADNDGFLVTLFAMVGHDLERLDVSVGRDGAIALGRELLLADLPTVYWH